MIIYPVSKHLRRLSNLSHLKLGFYYSEAGNHFPIFSSFPLLLYVVSILYFGGFSDTVYAQLFIDTLQQMLDLALWNCNTFG